LVVAEVFEAMSMRLRERIAQIFDHLVHARQRVYVDADDVGVRLVLDGGTVSRAFDWGDVTEIWVFKRDLGVIDDVRLAFQVRGGWYEFSEEQKGFVQLGEKMREVFPDVPVDWFAGVVQPPFATDERLLLRRPAPQRLDAVSGDP
jgi:hypothetical protein